MTRLRKHTISFAHAINGIVWAFRTQPNFQVHLLVTLLVFALSLFFEVTVFELALLIFAIVLVMVAEMINTAIEAAVDLATTEWKFQAKIAKDVSAGMVLIASLGAVTIGALIFIPHCILFFLE